MPFSNSDAMTKRMKLTLHITEHENGGRFYEWELRNVQRWEVLGMLESIVDDLKSGRGIIVSSIVGPKE